MDYSDRLQDFSVQGNRVIALAWKGLGEAYIEGLMKINRYTVEFESLCRAAYWWHL